MNGLLQHSELGRHRSEELLVELLKLMRLLMRLTQLLNCRAAQFSVPLPMGGVVLLEQRDQQAECCL